MQEPTPPSAVAAAPMFSRAAWAYMLPFLAYMGFLAIAALLAGAGVSASALRWLYPVKIGVVVALLAVLWRHYTELHTFRLRPWQALVALATGVVVLVLWVSLNADWMIVGTPDGFDPRTDGRIDYLMVALRIAGAALVVPVMEELFWRAFLLRWIDAPDFQSVDPMRASLRGIITGIVLFGFEHNQWLAGIVAGAAYTALYMRHRTLWSPILAHAVTNALLGAWIVSNAQWSYW
jgi:CAAX prenyl protease-like protein